jgi:hypothetical protein
MAQGQSGSAVADAPDTLPSDFFDKKKPAAGEAPDTLPGNFFDEAQEEPSEKELPSSTPRLRKAVAAGKAPASTPTEFEKGHTPSPDDTGLWNRVTQGAKDVGKLLYGMGAGALEPTLGPVGGTPGKIADLATSYASRRIPNIGQEGNAGGRSPAYSALATGAQAAGIDPTGMEASAEHGDPMGVATHAAAQATPVGVAELARHVKIPDIGVKSGLADRFATPAIAPGLSEPATANLGEPIARRGVEKTLRATGMPSGNVGLRESFSIAAPDLAEIERKQPLGESGTKGGVIRPDMRLRQTVENIDNRLDDIWKKERQPQIDRNAELPAISREQLLGDATIDQLKRIEKTFKMDIPDQINLGEADKMLVKVNARLRRAEGMTPEARALALELSPDLQKFNEMKGELHKSIGDLLERVNEPGIKEFNRRYGALSEVRDALRTRMNPVEAERVLDAVRATGGLGRNVNLFERLHLKASPGRLAQKGLEDLAQSNLRINPPAQRPPVAGLLPPIPEPLPGPVPESGSVRGGRWTTPAGLIPPIAPIEGEYIPPPETTGADIPYAHQPTPPTVPPEFRVQAPRMRSGTIPPIEPVTSTTNLPGGGVRNAPLLPGPASIAATAPPPVASKFRIEPIVPATPPVTRGEIVGRGQLFKGPAQIPQIPPLMLPEKATGFAANKLPFKAPLEPTAPTKPIMEGAPPIERPTGQLPLKPEAERAAAMKEIKPPSAKGKIKPVAERLSTEEIAEAEGLLASEAGAMATGDRPGAYFDESEQGDVRLGSRGAQTRGGDWRGVKSGRRMYPFMRENPDVNPQAVLKALRNKDSAAYNKLITRADNFIKGNYEKPPGMGAMDFLKALENPDAEPETIEPGADVFAPPEQEAAPEPTPGRIPQIGKGQTGVIPGMEEDVARQNEGAAKVAGEKLTAEANRPKDISAAAGEMETKSPLFRGTEASPQREIFGNAPPAANEPPATIAPVLKETGWGYEGKNNLGQYTIRMPGTEVRIHLFERELNPDFIKRQILAKEKQFGTPQEKAGGGNLDDSLKKAGNDLLEASKQHKAGTMSDEDYMKARRAHDELLAKWEAARGEAPPTGKKLEKFLAPTNPKKGAVNF